MLGYDDESIYSQNVFKPENVDLHIYKLLNAWNVPLPDVFAPVVFFRAGTDVFERNTLPSLHLCLSFVGKLHYITMAYGNLHCIYICG